MISTSFFSSQYLKIFRVKSIDTLQHLQLIKHHALNFINEFVRIEHLKTIHWFQFRKFLYQPLSHLLSKTISGGLGCFVSLPLYEWVLKGQTKTNSPAMSDVLTLSKHQQPLQLLVVKLVIQTNPRYLKQMLEFLYHQRLKHYSRFLNQFFLS